jgi:hypothetical protein
MYLVVGARAVTRLWWCAGLRALSKCCKAGGQGSGVAGDGNEVGVRYRS